MQGIFVHPLLLVDIVLNFRTGWVLDDGGVVLHIPSIRKYYFKLWFWIDLISIIPFDTVIEYAQVNYINSQTGQTETSCKI